MRITWYYIILYYIINGLKSAIDMKDTDSKHIDPIHCVFVIVPVEGTVTAKQNSGLTTLWLKKSRETISKKVSEMVY